MFLARSWGLMSPRFRYVHAAAFTVPHIAHLGQAAALQVVATALDIAGILRRSLGSGFRCLSLSAGLSLRAGCV